MNRGEEEVCWWAKAAQPANKKLPLNCSLMSHLKPLISRSRRDGSRDQSHPQRKKKFRLDHFEGRSWTGLHHHCLMAIIAFTFLQSRRLKTAKRKKGAGESPLQLTMPAIRQATSTSSHGPRLGDIAIARNSSLKPKPTIGQSSARSAHHLFTSGAYKICQIMCIPNWGSETRADEIAYYPRVERCDERL